MYARTQSIPLSLSVPRHLSSPLAWLVSGLLHIFILVQFVAPAAAPKAPVGYWVEMVPTGNPELNATRRRSTPRAPVDTSAPSEREKVAQAPATPQEPVLGNTTQATGLSGPIGDLQGVQASVRERYLYELEAFINQHKSYPVRARHMGLSGRVEVGFHLDLDGTIRDPHVVRPCLHDLLNDAAVKLVADVGRFRPIPAEMAVSVLHVTVPIEYELH